MITLITHIYNEGGFFLPFWIRHHRNLCDRAVIINYGSTDSSEQIFEEDAPSTWEWVESSDDLFYAEGCDTQVMEQERRFEGWKMALNITEFLFTHNLNKYLD